MLYYLMTKPVGQYLDCAISTDLDSSIRLKAKGWQMIGFMRCKPDELVTCARNVLQDYYKKNFQ